MFLTKTKIFLVLVIILFSLRTPYIAQSSTQSTASGGLPVYEKSFTIPNIGYPIGIASNGTHIFVADSTYDVIDIFNINGLYITSFGSHGTGQGQFNYVDDILYFNNKLYVVDGLNNRIQVFTTQGTYISQFGSSGSGNGQFNGPYSIAANSTNLFVVDTGNYRVEIFDLNGNYIAQFGSQGSANNQFTGPWRMAVVNNRIYVSDSAANTIKVYNSHFNFLFAIRNTGASPKQLTFPFGLAITNNFIYTTNEQNQIFVFDLNGNFQSEFNGVNLFPSYTDQLFTQNNKLYIANDGYARIDIFDLLSPPTNVRIFDGTNSLTVAWDAPQYATQIPIQSYIIYRSTDNVVFNEFVKTSNSYYVDTAVKSGVTYYYKVAAVAANSSVGTSDLSTQASGSPVTGLNNQITNNVTITTTVDNNITLGNSGNTSNTSSGKGFLPFSETAAIMGIFTTIVIIRYKKSRKQ